MQFEGADVYVAPRSIFGRQKVSLHASGYSKLGMTSGAAKAVGAVIAPRLDEFKLDRTDEAGSGVPRVVHGLSVILQDTEMTWWNHDPHPDSIEVPCLDHGAVRIYLLIGYGPSTMFDNIRGPKAAEIHRRELSDGGTFCAVHTFCPPFDRATLQAALAGVEEYDPTRRGIKVSNQDVVRYAGLIDTERNWRVMTEMLKTPGQPQSR